MIKKIGLLTLCFSAIFHAQEYDWNILVYMECAQALHQPAIKTLNEMAASVGENINLFVILHDYGQYAWVYRLQKNNIAQLEQLPLDGYASHAIIPVMRTMIEQNKAEHNAVILWNHGFGILVPFYNQETEEWQLAVDETSGAACTTKRSCMRTDIEEHKNHKGMLVNIHTQTCMGNKELVEMFRVISQDILKGEKLDVAGFDMCKAAMLEHAYQLKDYVQYMVGSQECELLDGWPYEIILTSLAQKPAIDGKQMVETVVDAYEDYYNKNAPRGIYTQSAIDLNYAAPIKEQLDLIVTKLIKLADNDTELMRIIAQARSQCRPFCDAPMYMDLYTFFRLVQEQLYSYQKATYIKLADYIEKLLTLIDSAIVKNACGSNIAHDVHGISIYFPRVGIDPSYVDVAFARESGWLALIETSFKSKDNV